MNSFGFWTVLNWEFVIFYLKPKWGTKAPHRWVISCICPLSPLTEHHSFISPKYKWDPFFKSHILTLKWLFQTRRSCTLLSTCFCFSDTFSQDVEICAEHVKHKKRSYRIKQQFPHKCVKKPSRDSGVALEMVPIGDRKSHHFISIKKGLLQLHISKYILKVNCCAKKCSCCSKFPNILRWSVKPP